MGSGQARAKGGLPKQKLTMFAVGIRVPASKLVSASLSSADSK